MLPDTWIITAASSLMFTQEDCTTRTLLVSRTQTNFGDKSLQRSWTSTSNYLPTDLGQPDLSYSHFRQSLKTFLLGQWDQCTVWIPL